MEQYDIQPQPQPASGVQGLKRTLFDWLDSIIIAAVVVILLFTFVLRTVGIIGISMQPTFYEDDRIIIYSLGYEPAVDDVVVISRNISNLQETETVGNEPIIKRVIATEGMWVDIRLEKVNGKEVGVVYTGATRGHMMKRSDGMPYISKDKFEDMTVSFPLQVRDGYCFVLGDNRNHSTDSRYTIIGDNGQIDTRYILGKAVLRIYPLNEFGWIG